MSHYFEINWKYDKVGNYILEILTLNLCKLFFPATFVISQGTVNGTYDLEGFRKLNSVQKIGTEDGLTILIELIKKISNAEKHYIFCDQYEINSDTVYIDKGISNIKMVFVPSEDKEPGPEQLINLVKNIMNMCPEEGKEYLNDIIAYMSNNSFNYKSIINHMEKIRKEVYLCAIE